MQLFFLVAGFFARFLYLKIGRRAFIRHRLKRIALPFLLGLVIIVPLTMLPFIYYKYKLVNPGDTFFQSFGFLEKNIVRWHGMAHLWFLYYLLIFYVLMILLIMIDNKVGIGKKIIQLIYSKVLIFPRNLTLLLLVVAVFSISSCIVELPIRSYTGFKPDLALWAYYLFFFTLGYIIHKYYLTQLEVFKKNAVLYVLIGILIVPFIDRLYQIQQIDHSFRTFILIRLLFSVQSITLVFGFLGLAIRFLSSENHMLRYISDASYWMYLIHLPLLVSAQLLLIKSPVPPTFRFLVVNFVGIGIPLLTYELFVRYTVIGKLLNGPRTRKVSKKRTFPKSKLMHFFDGKRRLDLQKRT